jgi:hypothetical protein
MLPATSQIDQTRTCCWASRRCSRRVKKRTSINILIMLKKFFPSNRLINAEDLMKTWRIIVMIIFAQILGLIIGVIFPLNPDRFLSIWTGGAFGTLPGFILGVIWYFKSQDPKNGIPYFTIGFFAIGSVVLPIAAFGLLNSGLEFNNLKEEIKALDPTVIEKLVVYKGYRKQNILEITDHDALYAFTEACKDIEGDHIQNTKSCRTIDRYYIELNGILPKDIILDHCETELATGTFATREGNKTSYHGNFSSKSLKPWLNDYVLKNMK